MKWATTCGIVLTGITAVSIAPVLLSAFGFTSAGKVFKFKIDIL